MNTTSTVSADQGRIDEKSLINLIKDMLSPKERENALAELSKHRESIDNLAVLLWNTPGIMACLLNETVSIYPLLNPPSLTTAASNKACNALALLQCVAAHELTRDLFLEGRFPLYLYPFLNTTSKTKPFEYIRLTSLGVIGALVRNDSSTVIDFLLKTEIVPLCLRILDIGTELSKIVSLFILQKISCSAQGIAYVVANAERMDTICCVLVELLQAPTDAGQTLRVVKHVLKCLHTLALNEQCAEYLKKKHLERIQNEALYAFIKEDGQTKGILNELLSRLK